MRADDRQFLSVSDQVPVCSDKIRHDAHLDVAAQVLQAVHALRDALRGAGGFHVYITAKAAGQLPDFLSHITFCRIQHDVRAVLQRFLRALRADFNTDQELRHGLVGDVADRQADGAEAGDHDDVLVLNMRLFQRVHAAGDRLDQDGLLLGKGCRQLVLHGRRREVDILGKASVAVMLEAENGTSGAHPVSAGAAEFALPAGHDLLGTHVVSDLEAFRAGAQLHDFAEEFVALDAGAFNVAVRLARSPEADAAVPGLQIARADTAALHFQQDLALARHRLRIVLIAHVAGCVSDNSFHHDGFTHLLPPYSTDSQ